ncbi:hypothetical protein RSC2_01195 [Bacillus paralicheniformis]|nr:hypothetical protein RSC1_03747 [Bacillus paralicheniformis]BCE09399.1 hypothetical protein RSC2_01195 [Bacillus paralicheniformis]
MLGQLKKPNCTWYALLHSNFHVT